LIITIAACIVCLGAGIVIGTGLNESNLSATGITQTGSIQDYTNGSQDAEDDFAAMDPQELEKALSDYSEKLWIMKERQELARTVLAEIRENADKGYGSMTDELYRSLTIIYEAGEENEEIRLALHGLDKIRGYKPESMVDSGIWDSTAEMFEKVLDLFDEAVAYYEPIVDDIWGKLSTSGA
jgi:hypothetical protein